MISVLRNLSIATLHTLLLAHENDSRVREPAIRQQIAQLYLPVLGIVLDNVTILHDPHAANHDGDSVSGFYLSISYNFV